MTTDWYTPPPVEQALWNWWLIDDKHFPRFWRAPKPGGANHEEDAHL